MIERRQFGVGARRKPVAPVDGDAVSEHPAFRAWASTVGTASVPTTIENIYAGRKSMVYRLVGTPSSSCNVVAKQCKKNVASLETTFYEKVLPELPAATLRYYGCLEGLDSSWIFLEDAGTSTVSKSNIVHTTLAASWLARLHTSSQANRHLRDLPERGLRAHYEDLTAVRSSLAGIVASPEVPTKDGRIKAILSLLDATIENWANVEAVCSELPTCLVHGDFKKKNIHVRQGRDGLELYPVDWEMAGRGIPVVDLGEVADLTRYRDSVLGAWPELAGTAFPSLVACGVLLRSIKSIYWESRRWSPSEPRLQLYAERLSKSLAFIG